MSKNKFLYKVENESEKNTDWRIDYLLSFEDDRNYDIHIQNDQISLLCNICHADYSGSIEKLFLDFWTGSEIDLCDCKDDFDNYFEYDEFDNYFDSDSESSF